MGQIDHFRCGSMLLLISSFYSHKQKIEGYAQLLEGSTAFMRVGPTKALKWLSQRVHAFI
jgi:hypothetical protein